LTVTPTHTTTPFVPPFWAKAQEDSDPPTPFAHLLTSPSPSTLQWASPSFSTKQLTSRPTRSFKFLSWMNILQSLSFLTALLSLTLML
jgi:hypothetical protein